MESSRAVWKLQSFINSHNTFSFDDLKVLKDLADQVIQEVSTLSDVVAISTRDDVVFCHKTRFRNVSLWTSFLGKLTQATFRSRTSKSESKSHPIKKIYTEAGMKEEVMQAVIDNWIVYIALTLSEILRSKLLRKEFQDEFVNDCLVICASTPYSDIHLDYDSDEDMSVDPEADSLRDLEEAAAKPPVQEPEDVLMVIECRNKTKTYSFNGMNVSESVAKDLKKKKGVKVVVKAAKVSKPKRKRR
jgi:hypothetical protein